MARGRFITLEGGEGVGKSTQAKTLAKALVDRGIDVLVSREPGGSPGAEAIRTLLLDGTADRWTTEAETLLFAAARADHVARTIVPALDRGQWVLCDRFLDSSLAYQGGGDELGIARVRAVNDLALAGLLPDRTLVLLSDQGSARARMRDGDSADRIGGRQAAYFERVDDAFRALADGEPKRVRLVDAGGTEQAVTMRLLAELADLLP